jgi:GMP reductase
MLSGTTECEGSWVIDNNKKYFKFYGMSSHAAQNQYGERKDYRASEGRVKLTPHKGDVDDVIKDILGGLRSACAYIGATSLKDMNKCAEFNIVNRTHFDQSV